MRNHARRILAILGMLAFATPGFAAFPERPPRIVSEPALRGGDRTRRRARGRSHLPLLGQRVAVENRTGVNGAIGARGRPAARPMATPPSSAR